MPRPLSKDERSVGLQLIVVGGFIFVAFMLFALAQSIYRDTFQVGGYIRDLQERIHTEQAAVASQQDELAYANTPQYRQKMAKELLGLKAPGEEVIVLTDEVQDLDQLLPSPPFAAGTSLLSNPQRWLRYLFGGRDIDGEAG